MGSRIASVSCRQDIAALALVSGTVSRSSTILGEVMKSVMTVEFSSVERITPLVSGYLRAYAATDPVVRNEYEFDTYSTTIRASQESILGDLVKADADVYALSAYIWNSGLVRSVLRTLRHHVPRAKVILGGPQVMNHAEKYIDPHDENVTVCNGEGEITFTEYLRELTEPVPDLSKVDGLSFYRDSTLVTTEKRSRISDLDSIPSPFLTGTISPEYSMAIIETNRGCPYHCGFCYWGAATNDRVYRFDEDRLRDELTWMARNGVINLYIADANWGMLSRDIDLSRHIADCARKYGLPNVVTFSAAKNKPHAVTEITGILQDADLVTTQPISLQTLSPETLKVVSRKNIKLEAYQAIQRDIHERGLSSYIELIWPLPGETLTSFKEGIGYLLEQRAHSTIVTYPHLVLNNTPIYHNQKELGLETREVGGDVAEARVVVATREVSREEFADGMRFYYAVHSTQNARCLYYLSQYLVEQTNTTTYHDLYSALAKFWKEQRPDSPISRLVEDSIREARYYDLGNYGSFVHAALHQHRVTFTRDLADFVRTQPWWEDDAARALFEVDLVNRPYVYSNTPLEKFDYPFEALTIHDVGGRGYSIEVSGALRELLVDQKPPPGRIRVDHMRSQHPHMPSQSFDHNSLYCFAMIQRVADLSPEWSEDRAAL
ncbi:cobalamin-dependent protein [Amycolatopsis sp. NPDC059027]|uniref:cobalamin-dependent protein n=1 Tax=unclassified Amycolatopsis TaxID=2618356 RepID=UPI00366CE5A3